MRIFIVFILFSTFLIGCTGTQKVKREGVAPQVSEKFDPKGHIEAKTKLIDPDAKIPSISEFEPVILAPSQSKTQKLYSVSALNVPVEDVLFQLAKDAGMELDMESAVTGKVSINAINQPLESILKRLTLQVSGTFSINNNLITIGADVPYWQSYKVNYVNLKKKSTDAIVMKMSVGDVGGASANSAASQATQTKVEMVSEHDFWLALEQNLNALASAMGAQGSNVVTGVSSTAEGGSTSANATAPSVTPQEGQTQKNVVINRESGLISVYATQKNQKNVEAYLSDALERSNRQVLIEATVVEVELSDQYQAGIDWASISGNTQASQSTTGANFTGLPNLNVSFVDSFTSFNLSALQRFGDTKVLSSPRIMAVSNQTALLKVVDNEVYFTVEVNIETGTNGTGNITTYQTTVHTVPVGFMMSLTPFIMDNNDVSINVRPTISRIIGYTLDPNPSLKQENIESKVPVIQEREMSTVLKLRNNQTAIIGGLIQDQHVNNRAGVPGLSKLPVVGDVFAYTDDKVKKNELVIFIRPVVITNPDVDNGDLQSQQPFLSTDTLNNTMVKQK